MSTRMKMTLSILGLAMLSVSTTYTANGTAPAMAYVAAGCASVGSYLVGLFQTRPRTGK